MGSTISTLSPYLLATFVINMLRLGVLALCCILTYAQNEELQAFMDQAKEDYKMLGMAIGAFRGNEWIMKAQIGVRHADDPTPIGDNDKFYLADAGRFITGMLAARVVQQSEGRITWLSTIADVFADSINVPSPFAEATLLDLLLHSGHILDLEQVMRRESLMDWYDQVWADSQWDVPEDNVQQRAELTNFLVNVECNKDDEETLCTEGRYSKFTYSVAVAMLEKFTGKSFDVLLDEQVFGPLGAPDCGVGPTTLDQSLPPKQPWSHFTGPWGVYNIPILPGNQTNMPSSMSPDDGLHCSLESWKNILSAHCAKNETFLTEKNWSILQDAGVNLYDSFDYAPGFVVANDNPFVTTLYHPGGDQKDWAQSFVIPEANVGFVVAANSNMQDGMRQKVGLDKIIAYVASHLSQYTGTTIELKHMLSMLP